MRTRADLIYSRAPLEHTRARLLIGEGYRL